MDNSETTTNSENCVTTSVVKRTMDMLNAFQAQIIKKDEEIFQLKQQVAASHEVIRTKNQEIVEYEQNEEDLRHRLWNISEEHCKLMTEWLNLKQTISMHEAEKKDSWELKVKLVKAIQQKDCAEKQLLEMKTEMCSLEKFLENVHMCSTVNKMRNIDIAPTQDPETHLVNTEKETGTRGDAASVLGPVVPNNQREVAASATQPGVLTNKDKFVTSRKLMTNSNLKTALSKKTLKPGK